MDVTIVIPVKNGGSLLKKVLEAVFAQKTEYSYEVVCIDSGSTDKTLEICNSYPCKVYSIKPEDFGHGKTRVYGASKGSGKYIVFITQDAMPTDENWLQNFIRPMEEDEEIAGAFGIHYPYPDCNIIDKRDLINHFRNFGEGNTIYRLTDENRKQYDEDEGFRLKMWFFSDNNACVRRDIFDKHPYDDVNFAEDQLWGKKVIELGMKKLYCAEAAVYHSHNFSPFEFTKRYFDEFKGLQATLGYRIECNFFKLPFLALVWTKRDIDYIRSLTIKKKEKYYWAWYSARRNLGKAYAGYIGGRYVKFPPFMKRIFDVCLSQQRRQRLQGKRLAR